MDYNYIRLEKQIKQLMNKTYVPSSSHAKSAEELTNGSLRIYVDTISKYFAFRLTGTSFDPLYIDPANRALLNVQYINNVDISKLIGGVLEGYGITIMDKGNGVYEINVTKDMFALKTELTEVDARFGDYTTTKDLEANYATVTRANEIDAKFANYATVTRANEIDAKFANYATVTRANEIDAKFANYTTTEDLEANYAKKGEGGGGEQQFTVEEGYPAFTIKNDDLDTSACSSGGVNYSILYIRKLPETIKLKIVESTERLNVAKFILRNNIIIDFDGKVITEVYSYVDNGQVKCPYITKHDENTCVVSYSTIMMDAWDVGICVDNRLGLEPKTLYMKGELSIMYLLGQDALVATQPTIRCDIIEAKNALRLHETDIHYFYKPSIITQETIDEYTYYKMIFEIPADYTIPLHQVFKFKEYCFGNEWVFEWYDGIWNGKNAQGKVNKKVINKANTPAEIIMLGVLNVRKVYGAWVMIKVCDWNKKFLPEHSKGLMYSLWENSTKKFKFLLKDGTVKDCADYYHADVQVSEVTKPSSVANYPGYDTLPIKCLFHQLSVSDTNNMDKIQNTIEKLYVEFYLEGQSQGVRLVFKTNSGAANSGVGDECVLNIVAEYDTIDKLAYEWESNIDNNTRNVVMYLRQDLADPLEEINWDPSTNAFSYIIKQQYYEITPNPNAATTLYTDYNITSSKIITADNITTMRSDLNIVTNNVDVIDYDVKELTIRVDTLNAEMGQVRTIMKYMQEDIATNRIIACTALALSVAGSFSQIGMQLSSTGIQFASKGGYQYLNSFRAEPAEMELFTIGADPFMTYSVRSITTDLEPLLEWCNSEYTPLPEIAYEDEEENARTTATSIYATLDICNHFRDSLKPKFKLLASKINEVSEEIGNVDFSDCVMKSELKRDDTIDVIATRTLERITLKAEDTITNGIITFKVFVAGIISPYTLSITFDNGQITEFKGTSAISERDRQVMFPEATLTENTITIERAYDAIEFTGVVVLSNTCVRKMTYTVNDIAYVQDIKALDDKIIALAEMSHANDVQTFSMQDEYATVEEVNTALSNYVQIKDLPPVVDLSDYYTKSGCDELFALKSENEELMAKITALEEENNELKQAIQSISSQLNQLINNVYTKNESDDKYLNKDSIVNELDYSRTDIKTGGGGLKSTFWFTDLTVEDLRVGFVFSYYDTSVPTNPVPIITDKYSFVEASGTNEIYLNEDETKRLVIMYNNSNGPNNTSTYYFALYDIPNHNTRITQYSMHEWYLESGYKFDSYNVYCKELVDTLINQSA